MSTVIFETQMISKRKYISVKTMLEVLSDSPHLACILNEVIFFTKYDDKKILAKYAKWIPFGAKNPYIFKKEYSSFSLE